MQQTDKERLNSLRGFEVAIESFLHRYTQAQEPQIKALEGIEKLDQILKEGRLGANTRDSVEEWMEAYGNLASSSELPPELRRRISHMLLDVQSRLSDSTNEPSGESESPDSFALDDARVHFQRWKERSNFQAIPDSNDASDMSISEKLRPEVTPEMSPDQTKSAGANAKRSITLRRSAEFTEIAESSEITESTDSADSPKSLAYSKGEEISHISAFFEMLWSEMEYLEHIMDSQEHALTALDEMLSYAEAKTDPMYHHLAASFIYFLKQRGYKMAPYVQRLRNISADRASDAKTIIDAK